MTGPAVVPVQGGTTSQYATSSTTALTQALRRALLDYSDDATGATARGFLKERLYISRAPDNKPVWPYAVMRLETSNDGRAHGMRRDGTLEVQVYGRPWAQLVTVNEIADLFDQAMLTLKMTTQGLAFCHGFQRAELPVGGDPVDSECCTVRLSYTLGIWPNYLTRLTRVLPPNPGASAPSVLMPVAPASVWFELYAARDGLSGVSTSGHPFTTSGTVTTDGVQYTFTPDGRLNFPGTALPLNDSASGFTILARLTVVALTEDFAIILGANSADDVPYEFYTLKWPAANVTPGTYGVLVGGAEVEQWFVNGNAVTLPLGDCVLATRYDRAAATGARTSLFRNGALLAAVDAGGASALTQFLDPLSMQIGALANDLIASLDTLRDVVILNAALSDAEVLAASAWLLAQ